MKHHHITFAASLLIAVISTAALAIPQNTPAESVGNSIIVGAPEHDGIRNTRLVDIPTRLSVVLKEFNSKAQHDIVGKDQPPLTEQELLAALSWITFRRDMTKATAKEYGTLQKIIESKTLVDGAYIESVNSYRYTNLYDGYINLYDGYINLNDQYIIEGSDVKDLSVWSIRLVVPHSGGSTAFTVRERFVGTRNRELEAQLQNDESRLLAAAVAGVPLDIDISENSTDTGLIMPDFNGNSIKVGALDDLRQLPIPSKLPAVVKEFNRKAKSDSVGKSQPLLTEEELLTALTWSITERAMTKPITKEYDTLQKIISSRTLTDGAYLKSVNSCEYRVSLLDIMGGTERRVYSMWTIFLVVPHADGTHAFPIRKQFMRYSVDIESGLKQRNQTFPPTTGVVKADIRDTRPLPASLKLSTVVREFNDKAQHDTVGKTQPALTEDELIAALQWIAIKRDPLKANPKEYDTLDQIIKTKALVNGAYLKSSINFKCVGPYLESKIGGSDVLAFTIWAVRLMVPSSGGTRAFSIRERYVRNRPLLEEVENTKLSPPNQAGSWEISTKSDLIPPESQGDSIIVGAPARGGVADNRIAPVPCKLADVVTEFNEKAHFDSVGKSQPDLTEEELLSALKWITMKRSTLLAPAKVYDTLDQIVKSKALVNGATLQSANRYRINLDLFSIAGGSMSMVFTVWSVRVVVPYQGGSYAFTIREQFVRYRALRTF